MYINLRVVEVRERNWRSNYERKAKLTEDGREEGAVSVVIVAYSKPLINCIDEHRTHFSSTSASTKSRGSKIIPRNMRTTYF